MIALIPDRKIPFITRGGGNTIGIYFWHNPIRYVLLYTGFFALYDGFMTKEGYWLAELILLVLCLAICVILSLDIFSRPLNALKKWTGSFSTKTCLIITASILAVGIVYSCIMGIG